MAEIETEVALVGAGPIGIEMAVALKKAGIDYIHFEKKQIAQTICWFPPMMRFFSSPDRIAICGVPIPRVDETKCSREEYLAYLRMIVVQNNLKIRTYEEVTAINPKDGFLLSTRSKSGEEHTCQAKKVILCIGDMHHARMIGVPGEELAHVSHYFGEPHQYFQRKVLIIGGKNSAVEAALRCYHCGCDVTICHREEDYNPKSVKYWLLPEMHGRIKAGEIKEYKQMHLLHIGESVCQLGSLVDDTQIEVEADFVLLMVGYDADMKLMREAGIYLSGKEDKPQVSLDTMQTNIPNLYVAGTAVAGSQQSYKLFIENCHIHVKRIMASLQGDAAPDTEEFNMLPES